MNASKKEAINNEISIIIRQLQSMNLNNKKESQSVLIENAARLNSLANKVTQLYQLHQNYS
ncbi:hypothetical protein [Apilactobacillus sp. EABW-1NA]|uniref:hypothetical protein n=1 Tax=Apilactobacillus sp. EABW-1NA TaxID=2984137 RepID=UPI0025AF666C|nr:hypothetical protein [Apilactobacillus sp. EABW-1NA]MDN2613271.1 hypothetical protein [Apilactobacillus sp. EABW-1NA]